MAGTRAEKLFEQRDLAVTTDFRAVLAEICTRHFGADADQVSRVFPNYQASEKEFPGICKA